MKNWQARDWALLFFCTLLFVAGYAYHGYSNSRKEGSHLFNVQCDSNVFNVKADSFEHKSGGCFYFYTPSGYQPNVVLCGCNRLAENVEKK